MSRRGTDAVLRFKRKVTGRADEVLQRAVSELLARVVIRSPVDTGRFRGAWIVAIGNAPRGEPGGTDRGGGDTIERGNAMIASASVGPAVFITNSTPYALQIEYGHSDQAPHGIVRRLKRQWPSIVRDAVRAVRRGDR